jgi:hypothetical protein
VVYEAIRLSLPAPSGASAYCSEARRLAYERNGEHPQSSPLLLCHPKSEAARLVVIDELNSRLFERCLNPN